MGRVVTADVRRDIAFFMIRTLKTWFSRSLLGLTGMSLPSVVDKYIDALPVHVTGPPTKPDPPTKPECVVTMEAWLEDANQLLDARWDFANNHDGRPAWPNFKNEWREAVAAEQEAYEKLVLCIEGMLFISKTPRATLILIVETRRALDMDEKTLFNDKWNQLRGALAKSLVLAIEAAHKEVGPGDDTGQVPAYRYGVSGHIACHDCKYTLHIGKVMHGRYDTPVGLHDMPVGLIETFIAIHLQHRIEIIPEQDFEARDWTGYDALMPMPTLATAITKVRSLTVGRITLRIEPIKKTSPLPLPSNAD